jgi:hypothetical protein
LIFTAAVAAQGMEAMAPMVISPLPSIRNSMFGNEGKSWIMTYIGWTLS